MKNNKDKIKLSIKKYVETVTMQNETILLEWW
jgi:hypothetical protein